MSREYSKILPSFWTGDTGRSVRAMGRDCQVVAFYLLTSPHASAIGLYHLPLAYLAADTGIPSEGASEALARLSEGGFCGYDLTTETVWVPEMARIQVGEVIKPKDNIRAWLVKEVERMRKRPFFNDFLTKYAIAYNLAIIPESKPLGSPSEAPSDPLRSQEREREQEREQDHEGASARTTDIDDPHSGHPVRSGVDRMEASLDPANERAISAYRDGASRDGVRIPVGHRNRYEQAQRLRAAIADTLPPDAPESDLMALVRLAATEAAKDEDHRKAGTPFAWFVANVGRYIERAKVGTGGDIPSLQAAAKACGKAYREAREAAEDLTAPNPEALASLAERARLALKTANERLRAAEGAS